MTPKGNEFTANRVKGYIFRDDLVDDLLRYIETGVEKGFGERKLRLIRLRNIVRPYVPTFFQPKTRNEGEGNWIQTFSWESVPKEYPWLEKEIEDIGYEIAEGIDVSGSHDGTEREEKMNKIFHDYGWKTGRDEPQTRMDYICPLDGRRAWRMDAIKDKVAVEVELSSRSQVFKDAFKFLIRQEREEIDAGVIMVPREHRKRSSIRKRSNPPTIKSVDCDMHAIVNSFPMVKMAFYGFPKKVV